MRFELSDYHIGRRDKRLELLPCGCVFHATDETKDKPCPRHADQDNDLAPTMVPVLEKPLPEETEDLE